MPLFTTTGALTGLGTLVSTLGGGAIAGLGAGIGSAVEGSDKKKAAEISNLGPVRGGSKRSGTQGLATLQPDQTTLERLGQTVVPINQPVYGPPVDFASLYKPQPFGAGYSVGGNRRIA